MDWTIAGPVMAGGAAIGSTYATLRARADAKRSARDKGSVDHFEMTLTAMQAHMTTISNDNHDLRGVVVDLEKQVRKCQDDKLHMGQRQSEQDVIIANQGVVIANQGRQIEDLGARLAKYEDTEVPPV